MISIAEFSRLTHLSVRTLRRYHDAGLLEPAQLDPASGYRYYTGEQIPTAQVIHRLRELVAALRPGGVRAGAGRPVGRAEPGAAPLR